MVLQPEVFERLIQQQPQQFALWMARGEVLADQREWSQAADHLAKSCAMLDDNIRQGPGKYIVQSLAALHLLANDGASYRRLCETVSSSADRIDDSFAAHINSRIFSLAETAEVDQSVALRLAERAVSDSPKAPWYLFGLGAALYRAGQYEQSIARLQESLEANPTWLGRSQNCLILAMACQKLRRRPEARDWLARAKIALDELEKFIESRNDGFAGSPYLSDWLAIQVLLPQAEELVGVDVSH